jgi:hypothetical protein
LTTRAAPSGVLGGSTNFADNATARVGTFYNRGGTASGGGGGHVQFNDTATAYYGTYANYGGTTAAASGGMTVFLTNSTAGNGEFGNYAATGFGGEAVPRTSTIARLRPTAPSRTILLHSTQQARAPRLSPTLPLPVMGSLSTTEAPAAPAAGRSSPATPTPVMGISQTTPPRGPAKTALTPTSPTLRVRKAAPSTTKPGRRAAWPAAS